MSPLNELIAYSDPGNDLSCQASGAITGKRFVKVAAAKQVGSQALANDTLGGNIIVATCTAGARPLGVATYDQISGKKVPVVRGHKVVPIEAGAAMTAGDQVVSDSTGRAVAYAPPALSGNAENLPAIPYICGQILNSPTAAGQTAIVALDL